MNRYLVYAPNAPKAGQNARDAFVLLKFKDPTKTYTKAQIDGLIARREEGVFEGSVNYCLVQAVDEDGARAEAVKAKLKYEEPGIVMMKDDADLDAFIAENAGAFAAAPRRFTI